VSLGKRFLISLSGAMLCAAVAMAQTAPTTIFQLDGNAASTPLSCSYGPCDNWDLLNGTGNNISGGGIGTGSSAGSSSVRTFINGTSSTASFQGGGSKDANAISQWTYATTGSPNKDTINAAYAAAYTQSSSFNLIFGADRLSPSGDANIGIWFFQQNVAPRAGSNGFTGAHADHDIFVISAFTGGGGTSTVSVYEWDHTCASGVKPGPAGATQCADANLRVLAVPTTTCGTSIYCGITNSASTNSTWEGALASPLFFEGGVNLTAAFAAVGVTQLPCFSSFLVETRSSQSTSAVLKDFLAGGFPVCGLSLSKNCGTSAVNSAGTGIDYPVNGIVTNTGVGTLYNVQVFDTVGSLTPATTCSTPGCHTINVRNNTPNSPNITTSTLAANETGTWDDTSSSTSLSQPDAAVAKGSTSQSIGATQDVTSTTATKTCTHPLSSSLSVTKSCTTSIPTPLSSTQIAVAFTGQVCNLGSSQVTGVALTDYPSTTTSGNGTAVASGITLAPAGTAGGTDCVTYNGSYVPTHVDHTAAAGRYFFDDLVTVSAASSSLGTLTPISNSSVDSRCNGAYACAPASCPLCQGQGSSGECAP
jgi:hypothetical protein